MGWVVEANLNQIIEEIEVLSEVMIGAGQI